MIQQKHIWILCAVMLILLATYSFFIPMNEEGLLHYNCLSLGEAWHNAMLSYFHMNPRIGEMLSYTFGHNANLIYIILNTLLSFSAILFIYRLGTGCWPTASVPSFCTLIFIFIAFLGYNSQTDWFLANMSWLYPCSLALAFFYLCENFFKGDLSLSTPKLITAIPLAFITGMSNNNTAIVSWILIILCGLYYCLIKKKAKISWQYSLIVISLTLSCVLFYAAPGNAERAQYANWELSLHNIIVNSLFKSDNWVISSVLLWRLLLSGLIIFIIKYKTKSQINNTRTAILVFTLSLLWGVLVAAPYWGAPRSFITIELLITCILSQAYFKLNVSSVARTVILVFHSLIMFTQIIPNIGYLVSSHREWNRIECMAQKAKAQGREYVVIKSSQLDFTPACSRLWVMPGSFFNYHRTPTIPLIASNEAQTKHLNHKHKWIASTWGLDSGDHIMNPIAARRLGLKAVYYIQDK